jgi:hypothetical protein
MMARTVVPLIALLLLVGCPMGDTGVLEPVIGGQVEQGDRRRDAVVRAEGISATVSGRWASERSQSAHILYVNQGGTPVSIPLPRTVLRHDRLGDADLWSVSDLTGADRQKNNVEPPVIYDLDNPATRSMRLVVKPGEQRYLLLGFTNYPGEERIKAGDRVTMTVPLGSRDAQIIFEAD